MKLTKRQLKRIIREEYSRLKRRGLIKESRVEPEGYVEDHAEMYAEEEDWDGYLEFGKQYGYNEDQLGVWFDAAEETLFERGVDSYEPELVKRGSLDPDELEEDFRTGKIDLVRNPYALD